MAKKQDDPNDPPRTQDEYVTGGAGGTGDNNDGTEGCSDKAAKMVAVPVALGLTLLALHRRRRDK